MRRTTVPATFWLAALLGALFAPATAWAKRPIPAALEALITRLDDADPRVREAAAAALVEKGERAFPALELAAPPGAPRGAAARVELSDAIRESVRLARRLARAAQTDVAFWMELDQLLSIEPRAVHEAGLRLAFTNERTIDEILARREAGRRAAIEFCRTWTDFGGAVVTHPDPKIVESNRHQEAAIASAGPTAAPFLLWVLSVDAHSSFRATTRGPRAGRDFVIAMHAVRLLKLREAVPYLLAWVNGQSMWAHGIALQTLEALTGEKIGGDAPFDLELAQKSAFAWWAAHRAEYVASTNWLLRRALREIHEILADIAVGASNPKGDSVEFADGTFEQSRAERLKAIVGDDLPLEFKGDVSARLESVRAAQRWLSKREGG